MKLDVNIDQFAYQDAVILQDVHFSIEDGQKIAVLGANGSGKSTLMKIISGLIFASQAKIELNGQLITENNYVMLRENSGIIFQNPEEQFVGSTVTDDLAFGLENHQFSRDEMDERISLTLKRFDLEKFAEHDPVALSGGQKQRVAIAGVTILDPNIIIFDESTSMLDPLHRYEFFQVINEIQALRPQTSQIMITHDLSEIVYFDRIIILGNKTIVFDGSMSKFLNISEDELNAYGLEVPKALIYARSLSTNADEIIQHYFEIVSRQTMRGPKI